MLGHDKQHKLPGSASPCKAKFIRVPNAEESYPETRLGYRSEYYQQLFATAKARYGGRKLGDDQCAC